MGAPDPAWKRSARLVAVLLLLALLSIAARWFPPVATPSPLAAKPPAADSRVRPTAAPPAAQTGEDAPAAPQRLAAREATLLVVDVLGEPVDADVEALAAPPAEPPGPGTDAGRARWTCACTDGEVGSALTLAAAPDVPVGRVAPGVEEVAIDLGDWSASVTGRWAGGGACDIAVFPDVGSGVIGACEADGSFFMSGGPRAPGG